VPADGADVDNAEHTPSPHSQRVSGVASLTPLDTALHDFRAMLAGQSDLWRADATPAQLRAAVRSVCALAREANLPPERLLVRLKGTLDTLPTAIFADDYENSDLREHVVSMAIDAYFSIDA
jgi:hypothetical protein